MIRTEGGRVVVESVQDAYRKAAERTRTWREDARESYDYVAGDQWDDEDKALLDDQLRPAVTFNRTGVYVEVITGLQAIQREEVQFIPRRVGPVDNGASDLWRAAIKYVCQDSLAEVHQSQAFRDLVISGMGWTESRMDFLKNPEGDVIAAERVDPLEMYWDWHATHTNLADARWILRVVPYSRKEVEERWPDKADNIDWTHDFAPISNDSPQHVRRSEDAYAGDNDWQPDPSDIVYVAHAQWWEPETFYRAAGPNGSKDVPVSTWRKFEKTYPDSGLRAVRMEKRSYKQAFVCGSTVLEEGPGVCDEDFSLQCMTGHHDRNRGYWYGLVQSLKDPQDWLNKLYSSLLHTISTNAKGGLIVEETAVANRQQTEDDWARPDKFTWVRDGAVVRGQIMPKPQAPYPQGMDRLMEVAIRMFGDVSGVNPELLGIVPREQAGVLEYQRKQAAMTTLAWAFDAMHSYLMRWGKVVGYLVQHYLADGRLIRVAGESGAQYIPLLRDNLALEYDVVVDTAPSAPNEKDRTFAVISQLMPILIKNGVQPPPEILDYLPFPASLTEAWKRSINQPNPMAQQAQQLELAGKAAEVEKTRTESMLAMARAERDRQAPELEQAKLALQAQVEERKAMLEALKVATEVQGQRLEQQTQSIAAAVEMMRADGERRRQETDILKASIDLQREHEKAMAERETREMDLRKGMMDIQARHEEAERKREGEREAAGSEVQAMQKAIAELGREMAKVAKLVSAPKSEKAPKVDTGPVADAIRESVGALMAALSEVREEVSEVRGRMDEPQDIERDEIGNIVRVGRKRVMRDADGLISGIARIQ